MKKSFYALVLCLLVLFSACSSTGSSSSFDESPVSLTSDLSSSSFTESASLPEYSSLEAESPSYPIENSDGGSTNKIGNLVYTIEQKWCLLPSDITETEAVYYRGIFNDQLWIFTETELNGTPVKGLDEEAAFQLAEDFYLHPQDGAEVIELSKERTEYAGCPALVLKLEYPDRTIMTAGETRQTPIYSMTVILLHGDTFYIFRLGTPDEPEPKYEESLLATLDSAYFEE